MLIGRKQKIERLKSFVPKNTGQVLEIGPNLAPMVTKSDPWKVRYLDMVGTDILVARALEKGKSADAVPNIDYVYDPATLISDSVRGELFDAVFSSHVVEHIPNLILHFQDIEKVLNDGGVYCMLVPDMRLCFDAKKPLTSLGVLVEAYVAGNKHAPISAIVDELRYGVKRSGVGAWTDAESGAFEAKYLNRIEKIKNVLGDSSFASGWHGHIWRFTPESFLSICRDCVRLGLFTLDVVEVQATNQMEFVLVLQKPPFSHRVVPVKDDLVLA